MSITIIKPDFDENDKYPLYCRFGGEYNPQESFLEVDCEAETISVDYNPGAGNPTPANVWERRAVRCNVSNRLRYDDILKLLEEAKPIAEKIVAGYESDPYSGGSYDEKADAAKEELMHLCDVASADADERYYYESAEEEEEEE